MEKESLPGKCPGISGNACHRGADTHAANDPFYCAAVGAAKTRTYRAAVTAGLSPTEREDLYQEILLDIYERKTQFDPSRGAPGTFTGLVSTHRTADFLNARKADRQKLVFAEPEHVDTLEVVAIDRAIHGCFPSQPSANDEDGGHIDSDHPQELLTNWTATMICFRTRAPSTTCSLSWPT